MKRFRGKIKSVSANYPFTVVMNSGKTFVSNFQFKPGWMIDLTFDGNVFDSPWPKGFVHCQPNGFYEYLLTDRRIAAAKNPKSLHYEHKLSPNVRLAVTSGIPVKWKMVESFYTYHYTATFDKKTNILRTNWPLIN